MYVWCGGCVGCVVVGAAGVVAVVVWCFLHIVALVLRFRADVSASAAAMVCDNVILDVVSSSPHPIASFALCGACLRVVRAVVCVGALFGFVAGSVVAFRNGRARWCSCSTGRHTD